MEPRLPGIWYAHDRQTAFFQVPDGADPKALFRQLFRPVETRRAVEGGVVQNACVLSTPDGERFQAFTWHGKRLAAWRRNLEESAQTQGIVTAQFHGRRLMTSDGRRFWFRDLVVERG